MSTPAQPLLEAAQQQQQYLPSHPHPTHDSVGPLIAVLFVITFLGILAGMVGRLCTGRGVFGRGEYDFEGWVEAKCASCIDGHVDPSPARRIHIPLRIPVEERHVEAEEPPVAAKEFVKNDDEDSEADESCEEAYAEPSPQNIKPQKRPQKGEQLDSVV